MDGTVLKNWYFNINKLLHLNNITFAHNLNVNYMINYHCSRYNLIFLILLLILYNIADLDLKNKIWKTYGRCCIKWDKIVNITTDGCPKCLPRK